MRATFLYLCQHLVFSIFFPFTIWLHVEKDYIVILNGIFLMSNEAGYLFVYIFFGNLDMFLCFFFKSLAHFSTGVIF